MSLGMLVCMFICSTHSIDPFGILCCGFFSGFSNTQGVPLNWHLRHGDYAISFSETSSKTMPDAGPAGVGGTTGRGPAIALARRFKGAGHVPRPRICSCPSCMRYTRVRRASGCARRQRPADAPSAAIGHRNHCYAGWCTRAETSRSGATGPWPSSQLCRLCSRSVCDDA